MQVWRSEVVFTVLLDNEVDRDRGRRRQKGEYLLAENIRLQLRREKLIELFSKDAYDFAVEDRKSFVGYKHLASVVCKEKRLDFLSDFVPEKITAEKALAERKPAETLPG
uniref:Uncharacterized protein n=1 Tax=Chenopodium quinoa TaxID=63459 RepID=A0A803M7W9_CHEQI